MTTDKQTSVCPVRFVDGDGGGPARPEISLDPHHVDFGRRNYQIYDELRGPCPVAWSTEAGGFWFLTGYAAVFDATQDDDLFLSSQGTNLGEPLPEGTGPIPIEIDPPDTTEYRKITLGLFSPKSIARLEPSIRRMANELIDEFIESGEADLVNGLSTPLPARTILRMLGMSEARWPEWVGWIHDIIHGAATESQAAQQEVFLQIAAEIENRTESGELGDDLLGALLRGTVHGEPISFVDQVRYTFLLLLGGMDTTSGLTGNSLEYLARDDDLRQKLIQRRDLLKSATEEFLRLGTPTQGLARTVSRDAEFHGQRLKAGQKVLLTWAAANRDPLEFEDASRLDIERHPNRHLAFGVGLHRCLGSNLARTLFQVMIDEILNRLPDFTVVVDEVPRFADAGHVYAPTSFPVRFTPGPRKYPAPS
jgi:cytochrome P450